MIKEFFMAIFLIFEELIDLTSIRLRTLIGRDKSGFIEAISKLAVSHEKLRK